MDHYVTLGAVDGEASNRFYDAVLATIGWSSHMSFPGWRAYSKAGAGAGLTIWVAKPFDGNAATAGNGAMLGLAAESRAQVDAFHAAAMANGGSDEGAPGPRPNYGPNWYAGYVRDPSGNKLAIVFNG
ncbi:VOC family protein [Sphingomonas sp. AX6]|uniref:VOC family protein n=1 Tax=Sphingomonas sp. AX6 TaxID=2653171 RepID=UPI0012F4549B|nr:VOC family protein [Sphingomonas sp. AX6]VXC94679.1 VOC family protein [Sphingomonas sp. AX6]